jgi:hypothetical protein
MLKTSSMNLKKLRSFSQSLIVLGVLLFNTHAYAQEENNFKLNPLTSMLMTGKGPGQDGSINPYSGQDCVAVVANLAKTPFSVRIQQKGIVLRTISVEKKETKRISLGAQEELYIDTPNKTTRFTINYEQPNETLNQ